MEGVGEEGQRTLEGVGEAHEDAWVPHCVLLVDPFVAVAAVDGVAGQEVLGVEVERCDYSRFASEHAAGRCLAGGRWHGCRP